jgi:putative endonuclease
MKLSHQYFVYVVECSDKSYYTGITNDLERRLLEHNNGFDVRCYTFKRRPVELKYYVQFTDVHQAIAFEKQWKGWGRKKKEALFREDWDELRILSKSKSSNALPSIGSR